MSCPLGGVDNDGDGLTDFEEWYLPPWQRPTDNICVFAFGTTSPNAPDNEEIAALVIVISALYLGKSMLPDQPVRGQSSTLESDSAITVEQLQRNISELQDQYNTLSNKTNSLERIIQDTSSNMATKSELGSAINGIRGELSGDIR